MSHRRPHRRSVMVGLGASASLGLPTFAQNAPRVVILGGGFGGASAAQQLRQIAPHIHVTLIEANPTYTACPFSNLVLIGKRELRQQEFGYVSLQRNGIDVITARAKVIDPIAKSVRLETAETLSYDRLILSPGIDFIWDGIEGYDSDASMIMPHGWKAGAQTTLLAQQLGAMPDGGTVVISAPPAPFRCPPGPYERASLIAHYLKTRKPKSKLLLLDAQDRFSKQPLFEAAWQSYSDIIERIPGADSGRVIRVDPKARTVHTDFDTFTADVMNIIPPQRAGQIAHVSDLTDASGWCPIDALTFQSKLQPHIHVIGDATIVAPMPKSAFSANLQGKVCAMQVARSLAGQPPLETVLTNTCYSFTDPESAVSVSGVYHNADGQFRPVAGAGGTSPLGDRPALRATEAAQAQDWFTAITREAFG